MRINKGVLVQAHYKLEDTEGKLIESTQDSNPLEFIFGMGMMLPAFEAELSGKEPGDKFDFVLSAQDAYGEVNPDLLIELPRSAFEIDGEFDNEIVFEGARVPMNTADGQVVEGLVTAIGKETVSMNFNHDLAGMALHFTGEVVEVHEPSDEEYDRYFGHSHSCGGCSCGDHGCGDYGCH